MTTIPEITAEQVKQQMEEYRAYEQRGFLRNIILANNVLVSGGTPDDVLDALDALQEAKDAGIDPVTIANALSNGVNYYRAENTRPISIARGEAAEVRRKLDGGATPGDLGFAGMNHEEAIASEFLCWFEEELNEMGKGK